VTNDYDYNTTLGSWTGIPTSRDSLTILGWYEEATFTTLVDPGTTHITGTRTVYAKLASTQAPTVNLLAKTRWERDAQTGEKLEPYTAWPTNAPFGPWADLALANTVLNLVKGPETVDVPVGSSLSAMNTTGGWNASPSQYANNADRYYADYYLYTNQTNPVIVLEIADDFINNKSPVVKVAAFSGSTATDDTKAGATDGTTKGLGGILNVGEGENDCVSVVYEEDSGKKYAYAKLTPVFTGEGKRGYAAYRIEVCDSEGAYPADGTNLTANDQAHSGTQPTLDTKGTAKSFTIYISYYKETIEARPGYTANVAPLKSGDRAWSQYGLLGRHIGDRTTAELDYKNCYYYQLQPEDYDAGGNYSLSALATKAKPENRGGQGTWPESTWQVGIRSRVNGSALGNLTNKEAVYVHLEDRYGNLVQEQVIQLNNFDFTPPTVTQNGNELTVTELGGSGLRSVQLYQYSGYGGPGYLQTHCTAVDSRWNINGSAITMNVDIADVYSNRLTLLVTDRVGNEYAAHLSNFTNATGGTTGGGQAELTIKFVDVYNTGYYPEPQGFVLSEPLVLADPAIAGYQIQINDTTEDVFAPRSGILAVAEPTQVGGALRLKVLTVGDVESLMVKSTVSGKAITYKPSNAVSVEWTEDGLLKIWTLEGDFAPGNVLVAAKIDGDWGSTAELVPVTALPSGTPTDGGEGGGQGQGIVEDPTVVEDDPTTPETPETTETAETPIAGAAAPIIAEPPVKETAAPAKNFFQVLLEWLSNLFNLFK
jgi:hypothetical protein